MILSDVRNFVGRIVILTILALLIVLPGTVRAQQRDSTLVARFQLAESFIRNGQYQRAIGLLEDLHDRSPETQVFYERLKSAYENVKRFDDAITLVQTKINSEPVPSIYVSEKARLHYLAGNESLALETWQDVIDTNPTSPGVYLLVYRSLTQVRLFDSAIDFLEAGRIQLSNPLLFQTDLAYLYSLTSQHERAIGEYLSLLEQNESQLNFVRSRLSQFLADDGAVAESIAATEAAVASSPLNRSFRELLAWLYIDDGRFREAFTINQAIDRLENEEGRVLFGFAQIAAEAGAYEVAAQAYGEILERYPEAVSTPDAMRGLGVMTENWATAEGEKVFNQSGNPLPDTRYHHAVRTYELFLDSYPLHPLYADVLRRIGRLQQDVFFDLDSAESTLTEVISRYSHTVAADEAALDMGRLHLMNNDLVRSEIQFTRLITRLRTGSLADFARLELAMLHFYKGQFGSAMALTGALQENTSTDVANDAIELKLLLIENKGPDSLDTPLVVFAAASLLERQRRSDEAITVLEEMIAEVGNHQILDDARFLRAGLLRSLGRSQAAFLAYIDIPLSHPKSFLADKSLLAAAIIQTDDLGDSAGAIETLTRLLYEYPGSLRTTEARARIRNLRGDGA